MPSVNMIAPRRAEKLRLERDMRRLVVVILVEIVFAVALGGWVCTKIYTTRNKIDELELQIAKLQPVIKEIKGYEAATNQLKPKLELLSRAKDKTMRWYTTLDELTQSLPETLFLTRIATTGDEKKDAKTKVNISGVSTNQAKVGEMMMRLNKIPDFTTVNLAFTQDTTIGMISVVEFEVAADMDCGEPAKGAKDNGCDKS